MALTDDFENVHASRLHRSPFSTLEQAVLELFFEETRISSRKTFCSNSILATPRGPQLDAILAAPHSKGHHQYETATTAKNLVTFS